MRLRATSPTRGLLSRSKVLKKKFHLKKLMKPYLPLLTVLTRTEPICAPTLPAAILRWYRAASPVSAWLIGCAVILVSFCQSMLADIIPPGCQGNGYGISLFVSKQIAHVGDTLLYTVVASNEPFPACQAENI